MGSLQPTRTAWWRDAIVYQVWPKSFFSACGTPTGDIAGVIAKLDYIKELGANTIWLSPHYASPMVDEGYDISDYESVNPLFGTLADAEDLIKQCHARGLRIIFDLVINHTSDKHKWFEESRSSRDNPKRDWYIWRPAKYDAQGNRQPPNNWSSLFDQPAWTWDEHTQEYYLHLFTIEQPDLNWTNDECRKAIYKSAMEFWLERGVDGFRVDTVNLYSKPMDFPDAPVTLPGSAMQPALALYSNGPRMHEYLQEMGDILARYDAMTVGECGIMDRQDVLKYVSFARNELSMVFQFDTVEVGKQPGEFLPFAPWTLDTLRAATDKLQRFIEGNDGWTTAFMENHDQGRSVSRFANDAPEHRRSSAQMLALLQTCLSGTPYIYQGQELGMTNVPADWDVSEYLDVMTINYLQRLRDQGASEEDIQRAMQNGVNLHSRDNARTPVHWTDGPNAGFTHADVKPWMRVNDNYPQINAAQQLSDTNSPLHFWRRAITLRKQLPDVFTYGTFRLRHTDDPHVFTFTKTAVNKDSSTVAAAVVLLNFSPNVQSVTLPAEDVGKASSTRVALSNFDTTDVAAPLQPYEGRVVCVDC